jgi:regulator of sirC expression with transglutaminase-like and TPR domain
MSETASQGPAFCDVAAYQAFAREALALGRPDSVLRAATAASQHSGKGEGPDEAWRRVDVGLESLANTVRGRARSADPQAVLAHLHDVLFELAGFHGATEDYYAPENSYLPDVMRRKVGIPLTLSMVYKGVADRLAETVHGLWRVDGVNAPGQFLVRVECGEPRGAAGGAAQYIDPFYGGSLLSTAEALERVSQATGRPTAGLDPRAALRLASPREWLLRMLMNLEAIFAQRNRERDLHSVQELQQLLRPGA